MNSDLVLWFDASLLVVNKPAGLPVLPDGYNPDAPNLKQILEPEFGRLWIVHRLDRVTSGVLLLARSAEAHRGLDIQFQEHGVVKVYHAIVVGDPPWSEKVIDFPLRVDGDRKHRTVVDRQHGKPSMTRLRVLERFGAYSLLEAIPQTGRTHQIRAHLQAEGLPLACDALYGGGDQILIGQFKPGYPAGPESEAALLARPALHARWLSFLHPETAATLRFKAPYPEDFAAALAALRESRG